LLSCHRPLLIQAPGYIQAFLVLINPGSRYIQAFLVLINPGSRYIQAFLVLII